MTGANFGIAETGDLLGTRRMVVADHFALRIEDIDRAGDGGIAVGIFNLNEASLPVDLAGALAKIGLEDVVKVRDLWRQKDLPMGLYHIAPHGVLYLKVTVK